MRMAALIVFLGVATPALAQQASPTEQALGAKLMKEINEGLTCNANVIALQAEIVKLQTRIRELDPKPEAKKE